MTNNEMLEKVIKETFPDIFENEPDFKVTTDICSIIRCGDKLCSDECYLDRISTNTPYGLQEYKGPKSNNNSSNSTTAIASGDISW